MTAKKTVSNKKASPKKTAPTKKAAAGKKSPPKKVISTVTKSKSGKDLYDKIQKTAYFIAEKDGFNGDPTHYWTEAKKQLGVS